MKSQLTLVSHALCPYVQRAAIMLMEKDVHFERRDALEIIEDRYGAGATILTSQLPTADWYAAIGDPTLADALCDRLLHNAYKFPLSGKSVRPEENKNSEPNP